MERPFKAGRDLRTGAKNKRATACVNVTMAARQVDGMSGSEPMTANTG
jgi:hypothetical protein